MLSNLLPVLLKFEPHKHDVDFGRSARGHAACPGHKIRTAHQLLRNKGKAGNCILTAEPHELPCHDRSRQAQSSSMAGVCFRRCARILWDITALAWHDVSDRPQHV